MDEQNSKEGAPLKAGGREVSMLITKHMQAQTTGPSSPPSQLTGLSREALLGQLASSLARLDSLAQTPPEVQLATALWFHRDEVDQVNKTWRESGIDSVLSEWIFRKFAYGFPSIEAWDPFDASRQRPEGAVVLLISEFDQDAMPDIAQQRYFGSSRFTLSKEVQTEIRQTLDQSGLLEKLLPKRDEETETILEGAPITEVLCTTEWYGETNPYGDGSTLTISLTLSPLGREPEVLAITVNKSGNIERRLWSERFMETGYEGHSHARMPLSETELRAIIPLVAKVAELTPESPQKFLMGSWLGNSLPRTQ